MIENNTSKFRGFDNGRITKKTFLTLLKLDLSKDRMTFVAQMISLNRLLSPYGPHEATVSQAVDEKAQDPMYFIVTYFDTKNIDQALEVYRVVKILTRQRGVLLSDKFFEKGEVKYALMAKKVRTWMDEFLLNGTEKNHLNYSLDY